MNIDDENKRLIKGRFLVAACAFIFNGDKILITKRSDDRDHDPGKWECVSGRFNQHFNTIEDEIIREVTEELGDDFQFRLIAPISFYHLYRANRKDDKLVGVNYICQYLKGKVSLSNEHTDYQWLEPEKIIQLDIHKLLRKDIRHLLKLKDIYFINSGMFIENFKKSN
jgi:isopentenyldiphosphate isomerase